VRRRPRRVVPETDVEVREIDPVVEPMIDGMLEGPRDELRVRLIGCSRGWVAITL
jgi:hypothetical protein